MRGLILLMLAAVSLSGCTVGLQGEDGLDVSTSGTGGSGEVGQIRIGDLDIKIHRGGLLEIMDGGGASWGDLEFKADSGTITWTHGSKKITRTADSWFDGDALGSGPLATGQQISLCGDAPDAVVSVRLNGAHGGAGIGPLSPCG